MQNSERCGCCDFFYPLAKEDAPEGRWSGVCRRRAPVTAPTSGVPHMRPVTRASVYGVEGFPSIGSDGWCGDFEAGGQKEVDEGQHRHQEALQQAKNALLDNWHRVQRATFETDIGQATYSGLNIPINKHRVTGQRIIFHLGMR